MVFEGLLKLINIHKKMLSKQFRPHQNILLQSKTIWTVQNNFGPIEGQGISVLFFGPCGY